MQNESNRKILGAFVVGVALVAGAYTVANFQKPKVISPQAAAAVASEAAPRQAITVVDTDNNGIEDWRDTFLTSEAIIIDNTPITKYVPPSTLTGRLGVNFFENIVRSKAYEGIARTQEEVIQDTVSMLEQETSATLYDTPDITVMREWTENDIKNYGNAMGGSLVNNNIKGLENEIVILNDVLTRKQMGRLEELSLIASYYKTIRDEAIATPVPSIFTKQHLDLINTYHALYNDIEAMTYSTTDPAVSLLRVRRYQDDALGLKYALENMYISLTEYSGLFTSNDPALIFINFSPKRQI